MLLLYLQVAVGGFIIMMKSLVGTMMQPRFLPTGE